MELSLLKDLLLVFALAVAVLLICHQLRVAATVGFLVTGVLVGPQGLGLIGSGKEVELLTEIGVVLLLFTIGLEFSLGSLLRIKRYVFLGGALQVLFTIAASFLILRYLGLHANQAVFMGFLLSLSSTAIVLRILQERAEVDSPHGQVSLAILIFQDMIVIPMMIVTPYLAGVGVETQGSFAGLILKGVGLIGFAFVAAKWIVPAALYQIARTRSRELFSLSVLVICFAVAFLTHGLGLSLALGAFLAGLIISETEFTWETLGNIIPFRHVFTSLFFVSIGMLLDVGFLIDRPGTVVLVAVSVIALKWILASLTVSLLGFPLRTSVVCGLSLCQLGEFSFVLFLTGAGMGLLEKDLYQLFLDVSVLTMAATPFAMALAPKFADWMTTLPFPAKLKKGFTKAVFTDKRRRHRSLRDHLIIVGFGLNGRNLARAAKVAGIPYVVIEMNPQTVRVESAKGEPIYYGDASQEAVLEEVGVQKARVVVVVISDPLAIRKIAAAVRKENPNVFLIVRTRFVTEMESLYATGVNQVIPEEFETSIEIFSRVLARYLIPRDEIERLIAEARAGGYDMFRSLSKDSLSFSDLKCQIPNVDIATFRVGGGSPIAGKSIAQMEIRKKHGVTVLAIRRGEQMVSNPDGNTVIHAGDLLVALSEPNKLARFAQLFLDGRRGGADECYLPHGAEHDPASEKGMS
jgi:monovalent cation:H+ antiporter-2, CPA2 family